MHVFIHVWWLTEAGGLFSFSQMRQHSQHLKPVLTTIRQNWEAKQMNFGPGKELLSWFWLGLSPTISPHLCNGKHCSLLSLTIKIVGLFPGSLYRPAGSAVLRLSPTYRLPAPAWFVCPTVYLHFAGFVFSMTTNAACSKLVLWSSHVLLTVK